MINRKLEQFCDEIRKAHGQSALPVDVVSIASNERIELAPFDSEDDSFDGRIEYDPEDGVFTLFYGLSSESWREHRARFTIAHELGHYFLDDHRSLVMSGKAHDSRTNFRDQHDLLEKQADDFAATLLLPGIILENILKKLRREFLSLQEITKLAEDAKTSLQCAAIRYVQFTGEACALVLSKNGKICYHVPSDDAGEQGLKYTKEIPTDSVTWKAFQEEGKNRHPSGRSGLAEAWYNYGKGELFEEVLVLGNTGYIMTLLSRK